MPEVDLLLSAPPSDLKPRGLAEVLCYAYHRGLLFTVQSPEFLEKLGEPMRPVIDNPTVSTYREDFHKRGSFQIVHLGTHSIFRPAAKVLSLGPVSLDISQFVTITQPTHDFLNSRQDFLAYLAEGNQQQILLVVRSKPQSPIVFTFQCRTPNLTNDDGGLPIMLKCSADKE